MGGEGRGGEGGLWFCMRLRLRVLAGVREYGMRWDEMGWDGMGWDGMLRSYRSYVCTECVQVRGAGGISHEGL